MRRRPEFRSGRSAAENAPVRSVRSVVDTPVLGRSGRGLWVCSVGLPDRPGAPSTEHDTVLDTSQSILRDMTIHEYLRHPQGMLFKVITKDMILDMIWIR